MPTCQPNKAANIGWYRLQHCEQLNSWNECRRAKYRPLSSKIPQCVIVERTVNKLSFGHAVITIGSGTQRAPSGVTPPTMVSVYDNDDCCTPGCIKTKRLCWISLSPVILLAAFVLFTNQYDRKTRSQQLSVLDSSNLLGDVVYRPSISGELKNSSNMTRFKTVREGLESKIHTWYFS